jgi:HK97 family phage prohead protease
MSKKIERKTFGHVVEVKQEDRNGIPVGIVEGYIATWDVDRGADRFVKGAFADSLEEHRQKSRPIRLKDHHGRTIGGFPIATVREDDRGLYGVGEINLDVQQGREAYALAKQGVLSDFSIGYSVIQDSMEGNIRVIGKAIVWEGSVVDEPMNTEAHIISVKSVVPFQDLPLADQDREWDSDAALQRVREFTDSEDAPSESYREAFLWFDEENADTFGAYKLPIADVVDGRLVAVPRGIFAAAGMDGVDLPEEDRPGVIANVERYYEKMDLPSPFEDEDESEEENSGDNPDEEKRRYVADDVKAWTQRDLEHALQKSGLFSKSAARIIAGKVGDIKGFAAPIKSDYNTSELKSLHESLQATLADLRG